MESEQQRKQKKKEEHILQVGIFNSEPDLLVKRIAELKHAEDIRALFEERLERVNHLYAEMASLKAILQEQAKAKSR